MQLSFRRTRSLAGLSAVSFSAAGSLVVLGPSGSGKSTLLGMLAGLVEPNEGTASIDGLDLRKQRKQIRARVSAVPATATAHPHLTVFEAIESTASMVGRGTASTARVRVERLLTLCRLVKERDVQIRKLPLPVARRVVLAQALSLLANFHQANQDIATATPVIQELTRCAPGNFNAWNFLAQTASQQSSAVRRGRTVDAITEGEWEMLHFLYAREQECLSRAAVTFPENSGVWSRLATAATFTSDYDKRAAAFRRAWTQKPVDPQTATWGIQVSMPKWGGSEERVKQVCEYAAKVRYGGKLDRLRVAFAIRGAGHNQLARTVLLTPEEREAYQYWSSGLHERSEERLPAVGPNSPPVSSTP